MTFHILVLSSEFKAQKQVRFDKKGDEGYDTTATANEEDESSSNEEN